MDKEIRKPQIMMGKSGGLTDLQIGLVNPLGSIHVGLE